jgi:TetR/AcrR family transcriptional regulator, cholesterol catabolism regulator
MTSSMTALRAPRKPAEARRLEILDTAAHLFRIKGYAGTSLQDVANAIGITKAAIYYHFQSKDDLLFEMHERIIRESLMRVRRIVAGHDSPAMKMQRILRSHIDTLLKNLDANVVFQRETGQLPADREDEIRHQEKEHDLLIRQVYSDGVRAGEFRDFDPAVAVNLLLGACNATYRWYRPSGRVRPAEVVDLILDLLSGGYRPLNIPTPGSTSPAEFLSLRPLRSR